MNRRGHRSKKIPNVRLRPADPPTTRRVSPEPSLFIQDSQIVGSDDTIMLPGTCPRPFKNVVLCATGLADKASIFKFAIELGASPISAFTDRVTHLIAEKHGGAKYQCALERKIPILTPSWIIESHRIWQHGDDVDLEESIAKHRLPIFSGVTLCISGLKITRRTQIVKELQKHGGVYMAELKRPVSVTHLLCGGEEETDKMHYADKFNRAKEADPPIQLIWEEWFWDCIEFGGRFDETRYDVRQPRIERPTTTDPLPSNPHDTGLPSIDTPSAVQEGEPDADEFVSVSRVPTVTLALWESLLKPRGYELNQGGKVMLSPKKARELEEKKKLQQPSAKAPVDKAPSVISSFRRANTVVIPQAGPSRLPFVRAATIADAGSSRVVQAEQPPVSPTAVFSGVSFFLHGETDTTNVREAIGNAGGRVVEDSGGAEYIIVRLVGGSSLFLRETSSELRSRYRTECWLEQCLSMERVCAIDEHITFLPLSIHLPVQGAYKIVLSFSGLDQSEACWIRRLMKALGITIATAFSRQSTHLLCPSGSGAKYDHALRWGTPIISVGWLAEIARTGLIPDVQPFLVNDSHSSLPGVSKSHTAKGKQKAEDVVQMQDITNNSQDSHSPPPAEKAFFLPSLPPLRSPQSSGGLQFGRASLLLGGDGPPPSPSPPKRHHPPSPARAILPLPPVARTPTPTPPAPRPVSNPAPAPAIPSSKSPSPLKRGVSISPPKPSEQRKRAFEESVVSLLGKHPRPATPEDTDHVHMGRAVKRSRAQQRKAQSRQASDTVPVEPANISVLGGDRSQSPNTTEGYEGLSVGAEDQEQSLRVVYEDPGQRAERERLANLIGISLEPSGGSGTRKQPKRTSRKPGF